MKIKHINGKPWIHHAMRKGERYYLQCREQDFQYPLWVPAEEWEETTEAVTCPLCKPRNLEETGGGE